MTSASRPGYVTVAACGGHRCAALRALSTELDGLAAAVRARPRAILVQVPCVGACDRACVVATGLTVAGSRGLAWLEAPRRWSLADRSEQARRLLGWIADTPAPDGGGNGAGGV